MVLLCGQGFGLDLQPPVARGGGRRHSPLLRTGSGPGGGSGVMRTTGDLSKLQPAVRAKLDAWKSRGGPSIGKAQNELDPR